MSRPTNSHLLRSGQILLAALALVSLSARSAQADVMDFGAWHDTMIFEGNNNAAGGGRGFFAGNDAQPQTKRGLISFDLSTLPDNIVITGVQLRLTLGQIAGSGGGSTSGDPVTPTVSLYQVFTPWGEANTAASTNSGLGGSGQGASPAMRGDATWFQRFAGQSQDWLTPGGKIGDNPLTDEVAATASASLLFPLTGPNAIPINSFANWLSTPALVADVQQWYDDPSKNFGWMLRSDYESHDFVQTFRGFYQRNYNPTGGDQAVLDANFRPRLFVTYEAVPEPSSIVLMLLGSTLAGAAVLRRRRVA